MSSSSVLLSLLCHYVSCLLQCCVLASTDVVSDSLCADKHILRLTDIATLNCVLSEF